MRVLLFLAIWLMLTGGTSSRSSLGKPSSTRTHADLLSNATQTPIIAVHHWVLKHEAVVFAPGTHITLYNTNIVRIRARNGKGLETYAHVSPDGKWLMFSLIDDILFASMTGSEIFTVQNELDKSKSCKIGDWGNTVWMADSDHWVRVFRSYDGIIAIVRSRRHPGYRHIVPLGLPKGTVHGFAGVAYDLLGALDNAHILASGGDDIGDDKRACVHLFNFTLTGAYAAVRPYEVFIPAERSFSSVPYVMQVVMSRSGNRLAWFVYNEPHYPNESVVLTSFSLMVSRIDGSQLRMIGSFRPAKYVPKGGPHSTEFHPMAEELNPVWLADEQHIRFIFRHTLWTVRLRTEAGGRQSASPGLPM